MKLPFADRVPTEIRANLRWRSKVHRRAAEDLGFQSAMRDACAADPIFFLNGFGWTFDPRQQPFPKLPFILYDFQKDAILEILSAIENQHDLLIEKSRTMGASWMCVSAFLWRWLFRNMQAFLFVSRKENYVDESGNPKALFWKVDFLLDNLTPWLRPRGYNASSHRRLMHIENPENGSVIDGESTNQDVSRGDRRTASMFDEFAGVENGQRVLNASRDATRCRLFNSTPQGIGNAFYDVKQTAIKKLRLHWSIHPIYNKGLYTTGDGGLLKVIDERNYPADYHPILDGKLRSPWYDGECVRATGPQEIAQELDIDYLGSGFQFFNQVKVQEAIRRDARQPILVGELEYDNTTADPVRFRESPQGCLRLWCLLNGKGLPPREHRCVVGVDVSAGTGASNSCVVVWDETTNEKLAEFASPFVRPEALAKQAVAIARWFGGAKLIWESNGPGRQFGSRVMDLFYAPIYFRQREEGLSKKTSDIPGWAPTKETKLVLIGEYRAAIESAQCANRSREALEECLEYIFQPGGGVGHSRESSKTDPSGAGASHGDRVVADALAWKCLTDRAREPEKKEPEIHVGCLAWRRKQREMAEVKVGVELEDGWW
jgi:hypothetical protein